MDWLYPPVCAGCGAQGFRFCPKCISNVESQKGDFCLSCNSSFSLPQVDCPVCKGKSKNGVICASWGLYKDQLRIAIQNLKYQDDIGLGEFFADNLIAILEQRKWNFDLVIPVPLSRQRGKERGYNQSALLSHQIAAYFHVQHSHTALYRIKETKTQYSLNASDRFLNVKDAFSGNPAKLNGRRVLIVDDIITTGATVLECNEAVLNAGAISCYGISIAKTG